MFSWFKRKKRDSFRESRQYIIDHDRLQMHTFIDLMHQIASATVGGEVKYYLVTVGWHGNVRTEGWSIPATETVASRFAYQQQLAEGQLALLHVLETTKETIREVELSNQALFRMSI